MSAFGPQEDLVYEVSFIDEYPIEETLYFVSSGWGMGVELRLKVHKQTGGHLEHPPSFRVLRTDYTWGNWHSLRHGHPVHAHARAIEWQAAGDLGRTSVHVNVKHFIEHPHPHSQHQLQPA